MSNLQWEWLHCYLFGLDWIVKVGCRHWWHGENNTAWVSLADGWWLIYSRLFLWMTVKYTSWQERMVTLTLYFYTFQRIYINEKVNERWMKRLNTSPVLSLKKWTHWFTGRYTYSADVFNLFQTEINTTSKQSKWTCDAVISWFGKVSHYQRIAFLIPFISFKGPWCKKTLWGIVITIKWWKNAYFIQSVRWVNGYHFHMCAINTQLQPGNNYISLRERGQG